MIRINSKSSSHVSEQFANCWLSRYPRANRCIHNNGGEFIGHEFQRLLNQFGIKSVPTTVKNPQSNASCERLHNTVGDVLRVILRTNRPINQEMAGQAIDNALATTMHSTRCAVNHTMRTSPGALAFNRDMLMDVPFIANLAAIRDRRQQLINTNLLRTNKRRIDYNYRVGDNVMIKRYDPTKLQERLHGPYRISQVCVNGSARFCPPSGHVFFFSPHT